MDIFYNIDSVKAKIKYHKSKNLKIGLVPTMGALHEGHMALIQKSLGENDITCCSIYVNPTQFNNPEDLARYPKTIQADLTYLKSIGCQMVFVPDDKEIYPTKPCMSLSFGELENIMEGSFRPGHFNGVGIVVSKLFNIIKPDNAYFGQKDLQQYMVIKQLVGDLTFDLTLNSVSIQRDKDGLALSSRNARLSTSQRETAPKIYEALKIGKDVLLKSFSISETKNQVSTFLTQFPDIQLEYFEIANGETLIPLDKIANNELIALCIAVYIGEIRLIDNLILNALK